MVKNFKNSFRYIIDNEFLFLLVSLLLIIITPIITGLISSVLLVNIILFTVIASSVYAVYNTKRHLKIGLIFGAILAIINFIDLYKDIINPDLMTWFSHSKLYLFSIFFIFICYHVLKKIIYTKEVTTNTIYGAISGYFLLGLTATFINIIILNTTEGAFQDNNSVLLLNDLLYYSFVTLSTLGYGDITPTNEISRTFSILVSTSGQMYSTILIGILIGKFLKNQT